MMVAILSFIWVVFGYTDFCVTSSSILTFVHFSVSRVYLSNFLK